MKILLSIVCLGLLLVMPSDAFAQSQSRIEEFRNYYADIYRVHNPGSYVHLHKYSRARGKVICKIPHNRYIRVIESVGQYRYVRWLTGNREHESWRDGRGQVCPKFNRIGWIDLKDRGVSIRRAERYTNARLGWLFLHEE